MSAAAVRIGSGAPTGYVALYTMESVGVTGKGPGRIGRCRAQPDRASRLVIAGSVTAPMSFASG